MILPNWQILSVNMCEHTMYAKIEKNKNYPQKSTIERTRKSGMTRE